MSQQKKSKQKGRKGVKLASYWQIPPRSLWALAEHFGRGSNKYEPFNYLLGIPFSSSYDAMIRHAEQWRAGEEEDSKEGGHHLIAVAWHALVLYELLHSRPEFDDRVFNVKLESEFLHD